MKDITFAIICDLYFLFELTIFYTIESIALESYSNFHHESANNRQLQILIRIKQEIQTQISPNTIPLYIRTNNYSNEIFCVFVVVVYFFGTQSHNHHSTVQFLNNNRATTLQTPIRSVPHFLSHCLVGDLMRWAYRVP